MGGPSSPEMPESGDFVAEAGAMVSKSKSRRFSSLLPWAGGGAPETAAATAAAARGFSRAFCNCSLDIILSGAFFLSGEGSVGRTLWRLSARRPRQICLRR